MVLKAVGKNPCRSLTELAELTANNKSLTFRILYTLEQQGFVIKDPKLLSYTLGYSALSLISYRRDHFSLLRAAEPILDRMTRQCDDNIKSYG
jgi:IclR family KDG regulon transcriptional repressor